MVRRSCSKSSIISMHSSSWSKEIIKYCWKEAVLELVHEIGSLIGDEIRKFQNIKNKKRMTVSIKL